MASFTLGNDAKEGIEGAKYAPHVPGNLFSFFFTSNHDGTKYKAFLISPAGTNPKNSTPILAWFQEGDNIINPEWLLMKWEPRFWKSDEQLYRDYTLYGEKRRQKVQIRRSVPFEEIENRPLACFEKPVSNQLPITLIREGSDYGKYIHAISQGKLLEANKIFSDNPDRIRDAYPLLGNINTNLRLVMEDPQALAWWDAQKADKIDDVMGQKVLVSNNQELNDLFEQLFEKKHASDGRFANGILPIVSKAFAYIPRE